MKTSVSDLQLFILIFSAVGSGPAGTEGIVGAVGLTLAIVGIVVFPLLWGSVQVWVYFIPNFIPNLNL